VTELNEGINSTIERKGLGLGIDAGGTYTDSVLYDFGTGKVTAWFKALTTHEDYALGIANCLRGLLEKVDEDTFSEVLLVSLSTTIATNAIVEGKGGRPGIILIGYDRYTLNRIFLEPSVVIGGGHTINGERTEPLDEKEAVGALEKLIASGVDAIAVSSEIGVRNPEYEKAVKALAARMTDIPVVCGSELTGELNCVKRANTCYLNARLLPLVSHLLASVRDVLARFRIEAPLMIVRGDGTLMSEAVASVRPIEMVLSGPAASIMGGAHGLDAPTGYVVDMGGTTTDAAQVENGFARFREGGISLQGFRTAVKTVDVHTFGLGGDSYVQIHRGTGEPVIGPRRVVPLCVLAAQYSGVETFLEELGKAREAELELVQPADFFLFQRQPYWEDIHPQEKSIANELRERGPLSRVELANRVESSGVSLLRTDRLESYGSIIRSALTPTDVLHALGRLSIWDTKAACLGLDLYAERAGTESGDFGRKILDALYRLLIRELLGFFCEQEGFTENVALATSVSDHLLDRNSKIRIDVRVRPPFVFIGAPARSYADGLRDLLDIDIIVPQNSEVAGAVGAITGGIRQTVSILIRPIHDIEFVAFSEEGRTHFETLAEAKHESVRLAKRLVTRKAVLAGARSFNVDVRVDDKRLNLARDDEIYLETVITASVEATPAMRE